MTFINITRWLIQLFLVGNVAAAIYLVARPRRKRLPPKTVSPMLAPYRQPGEVMPRRSMKRPQLQRQGVYEGTIKALRQLHLAVEVELDITRGPEKGIFLAHIPNYRYPGNTKADVIGKAVTVEVEVQPRFVNLDEMLTIVTIEERPIVTIEERR